MGVWLHLVSALDLHARASSLSSPPRTRSTTLSLDLGRYGLARGPMREKVLLVRIFEADDEAFSRKGVDQEAKSEPQQQSRQGVACGY